MPSNKKYLAKRSARRAKVKKLKLELRNAKSGTLLIRGESNA